DVASRARRFELHIGQPFSWPQPSGSPPAGPPFAAPGSAVAAPTDTGTGGFAPPLYVVIGSYPRAQRSQTVGLGRVRTLSRTTARGGQPRSARRRTARSMRLTRTTWPRVPITRAR